MDTSDYTGLSVDTLALCMTSSSASLSASVRLAPPSSMSPECNALFTSEYACAQWHLHCWRVYWVKRALYWSKVGT